jgi:hypothetical protein
VAEFMVAAPPAIGSHDCWVQASIGVIQQHASWMYPFLTVTAMNCASTLKVETYQLTVLRFDFNIEPTLYWTHAVRCAFFERNLHSMRPLVPKPARLKQS